MSVDTLPFIKCEDILQGCNERQRQQVEEYMAQFAMPETTELGLKCVHCGDYFSGTLGVANWPNPPDGTGSCYECGAVFRYIHDIPGVGRIENIPLMYRRRIEVVHG